MDQALPQLLARRLKQPLPGRAAQARFEPDLGYGRHFDLPTAGAREAAVLILLYPHQGDWHLPLTVRPATMLDHAGQISLPGGVIEAGETGPDAALRELEEELGVLRHTVGLAGALSPLHLFVSNYLVTPWVGRARKRPEWVPNPNEVAELLEVPLAHLADPANHGQHAHRQRGIELSVPHFSWGGHQIWGATSMILGELVAIVEELTVRQGPMGRETGGLER